MYVCSHLKKCYCPTGRGLQSESLYVLALVDMRLTCIPKCILSCQLSLSQYAAGQNIVGHETPAMKTPPGVCSRALSHPMTGANP